MNNDTNITYLRVNSGNTEIYEPIKQNKIFISRKLILRENKQIMKDICKKITNIVEEFSEILKDDFLLLKNQRFIEFINKDIFFDREVESIYHKKAIYFEKQSNKDIKFKIHQYLRDKIIVNDSNGIEYVVPTLNEVKITFCGKIVLPIKSDDNHVYSIDGKKSSCILYADNGSCGFFYHRTRSYRYDRLPEYHALLFPIARISKEYGKQIHFGKILSFWLEHNLLPKNLTPRGEMEYKKFMKIYDDLKRYINIDGDGKISFETENFYNDNLSGKYLNSKIIDSIDFKTVIDKEKNYNSWIKYYKEWLLNVDYKRNHLAPYSNDQISDIKKGHWELFEENNRFGNIEVELPKEENIVARPPQMDIVKNGVCSIDFGAKSTVVSCLRQVAHFSKIGEINYNGGQEPNYHEYPTAIKLKDYNKFVSAYYARSGRPFTEWEQLSIPLQVSNYILDDIGYGINDLNAIVDDLKQWIIDKYRPMVLYDNYNHKVEIKPFLELEKGDFNPLEIYAYYLGLYINNMYNGIFLNYVLSFSMSYNQDVRNKILLSFDKGIKKSLPSTIIRDSRIMKNYKIYLGANESTAYAVSALQIYGLQPKEIGQKVFYGVFDFGGGSSEFDFGMEERAKNRKCKYLITQFGSGGDLYLGGENILLSLAYEVYKDNCKLMRNKDIHFYLPPEENTVHKKESMVGEQDKYSRVSYINSRRIAECLRPIWEANIAGNNNISREKIEILLLNSTGEYIPVGLKIDIEKIENLIEKRITKGIDKFFIAWRKAFHNKFCITYPIHIFLAGNSCKSHYVKKVFNDFVNKEEEKFNLFISEKGLKKANIKLFELHIPVENNIHTKSEDGSKQYASNSFKSKITSKTAVAFGLLRSRKDGEDVKIINYDNL